ACTTLRLPRRPRPEPDPDGGLGAVPLRLLVRLRRRLLRPPVRAGHRLRVLVRLPPELRPRWLRLPRLRVPRLRLRRVLRPAVRRLRLLPAAGRLPPGPGRRVRAAGVLRPARRRVRPPDLLPRRRVRLQLRQPAVVRPRLLVRLGQLLVRPREPLVLAARLVPPVRPQLQLREPRRRPRVQQLLPPV
ncbi:MAG: hypothetical protein AVDCRST_MAG64-3636, partial [uncultured Phycisphaerae bacterium]